MSDPRETQALLRLFGWSIDNTEIADARAWYEVIRKDSPSAVRSIILLSTKTYSQSQPLLSLVKLEQALNNFTEVEHLFSSAIKGPAGGITSYVDIIVWSESRSCFTGLS